MKWNNMKLQRFEYVTYYDTYSGAEMRGPDFTITAYSLSEADDDVMLRLKNWMRTNNIKYTSYGVNCTNYQP